MVFAGVKLEQADVNKRPVRGWPFFKRSVSRQGSSQGECPGQMCPALTSTQTWSFSKSRCRVFPLQLNAAGQLNVMLTFTNRHLPWHLSSVMMITKVWRRWKSSVTVTLSRWEAECRHNWLRGEEPKRRGQKRGSFGSCWAPTNKHVLGLFQSEPSGCLQLYTGSTLDPCEAHRFKSGLSLKSLKNLIKWKREAPHLHSSFIFKDSYPVYKSSPNKAPEPEWEKQNNLTDNWEQDGENSERNKNQGFKEKDKVWTPLKTTSQQVFSTKWRRNFNQLISLTDSQVALCYL